MLFEVLEACLHAARGHDATKAWIDSIAADHTRFAGINSELYREFFEDLLATMAALLGGGWSPELADAWRRQTSRIVSWVDAALEPPLAR
jgi:hemoglobin-like flavoprotein